MTTPTDTESVESLAVKLSDLATREATTMPPGWPDAHATYSDGADTLRALAEERDRLKEELDAMKDGMTTAYYCGVHDEKKRGTEERDRLREALDAVRADRP